MNFQEKSYKQHSEHYQKFTAGSEKEVHAKTWFEKDTVDSWRHQRMYRLLDPILIVDPKAKWLTIGDGRYGNDAKYVIEKGCSALASDISDILLKEAKYAGYISEYKKENAESLSFNDSQFDYVLCKESYHHFPRPMLALYEMLRVARKAVVLIEPNDAYINDKSTRIFFLKFLNTIKYLLCKKYNKHYFEETGNYVFSISKREIEKVALGLNYKTIAFKGINDSYFTGVEYEKLSENGPLKKKVKRQINKTNLFCSLGFLEYGILSAIIFKQEPSDKLLQCLSNDGYKIICLPDNPYILG
jgi:ubiquinone/menaquinone biosynthesis C-methylase UbiE